MPTLPLYDTTVTAPGAWRNVFSPGGYQCWRLDAFEKSTGTVVLIAFHDGYWGDPEYQRRYKLFRRWPTRYMPPVPADFRAIEIVRDTADGPAKQRVIKVATAEFAASRQELQLRFGDYTVQPDSNGNFRIAGPEVDLLLTSVGIDATLWRVTGTVLEQPIIGRGVLHSNFDTAPRKPSVDYCILLADRAIVGSMTTDNATLTHIGERSISRVRELSGVGRSRALYSIADVESGIAIVDEME